MHGEISYICLCNKSHPFVITQQMFKERICDQLGHQRLIVLEKYDIKLIIVSPTERDDTHGQTSFSQSLITRFFPAKVFGEHEERNNRIEQTCSDSPSPRISTVGGHLASSLLALGVDRTCVSHHTLCGDALPGWHQTSLRGTPS